MHQVYYYNEGKIFFIKKLMSYIQKIFYFKYDNTINSYSLIITENQANRKYNLTISNIFIKK